MPPVVDAFNETVWRAHSTYAALPAELGKWLTYALTMRNDGNLALSWGARASFALSTPVWTSGRPVLGGDNVGGSDSDHAKWLERNQIMRETQRIALCYTRRKHEYWMGKLPVRRALSRLASLGVSSLALVLLLLDLCVRTLVLTPSRIRFPTSSSPHAHRRV